MPEQFPFFGIPAKDEVSHASVSSATRSTRSAQPDDALPLEAANPRFDDMMDALTAVA